MTFVIAEPCIGTKDIACVDACPVDCIHPKKQTAYEDARPTFDEVQQLYIDPIECIDCGVCVPVCPVSAIFALDDLPEKVGTLYRNKCELRARRQVHTRGVGKAPGTKIADPSSSERPRKRQFMPVRIVHMELPFAPRSSRGSSGWKPLSFRYVANSSTSGT